MNNNIQSLGVIENHEHPRRTRDFQYSRQKEFLIFDERQKFLIIRETTKVVYGGDSFPFPLRRELLSAQLVVDLIDKYGYSPETIEVGRLVKIDSEKKRFGKVDIIVLTPQKAFFMLINVVLPEFYQANLENAVSLLFQMAAALEGKEALSFLIYYSGWHERGEIQRRYLTIDYRRFKTIESWNGAGRLNEGYIPSGNER